MMILQLCNLVTGILPTCHKRPGINNELVVLFGLQTHMHHQMVFTVVGRKSRTGFKKKCFKCHVTFHCCVHQLVSNSFPFISSLCFSFLISMSSLLYVIMFHYLIFTFNLKYYFATFMFLQGFFHSPTPF